jgi:hypothetical protein
MKKTKRKKRAYLGVQIHIIHYSDIQEITQKTTIAMEIFSSRYINQNQGAIPNTSPFPLK